MKLDYVDIGSSDMPLIRLFDFTSDEARKLRLVIEELATGRCEQIRLNDLPYIQAIENCELSLALNSWDQAVVRKSKLKNEFECRLTQGAWEDIAYLFEPFLKDATGFQWLTGIPGEAAILFSSSGSW